MTVCNHATTHGERRSQCYASGAKQAISGHANGWMRSRWIRMYCTGGVLVVYWYHTGRVLALCLLCSGAVLVLYVVLPLRLC